MARIKLWGGFHNSSETTIIVQKKYEKHLTDLKQGNISIEEVLTPYQQKRLENHFCGIKECICCSFPTRVEWEIIESQSRRSAYEIAKAAIEEQQPIDRRWLRNLYNSMNAKERKQWAKDCLQVETTGEESKQLIGKAVSWFLFLIRQEI